MSAVDIIERHGDLLVSSETIAEGSGVQHKNVLELINANHADFEDFGEVAFETRPGYNNAAVRLAMRVAFRREIVHELSDAGMSTRAIAPIFGVSHKTIVKDGQVVPEVPPAPVSKGYGSTRSPRLGDRATSHVGRPAD